MNHNKNIYSTIICLLLGICVLFLTACSHAPVKDRKKIPQKKALSQIDAAENIRPVWIDSPPVSNNEVQYLVGLSEMRESESEARKEAMDNARREFAEYTGVEVHDVNVVIQSLYGEETRILDPELSATRKSTQTIDAQVSRIKAKKWYWEKYRQNHGGVIGEKFKYWVLVTVPADEYDRIQAWKKEKADKEKARIEAEAQKIRNYYVQVDETVKANLAKIDLMYAQANPLNALNVIEETRTYLEQTKADINNKPEPYHQFLVEVDAKLQLLQTMTSATFGNILLDVGQHPSHIITDSAGTIHSWIWFRHENQLLPVPNIPLALVNSSEEVLVRAKSDGAGRTRLDYEAIRPGSYQIVIDMESSSLLSLNEQSRMELGKIRAEVNLIHLKQDMRGATRKAVEQLFRQPAMTATQKQKIVLGAVVNEKTKQGSRFAIAISQNIREAILSQSNIHLVSPRTRSVNILKTAAQKRGISTVSQKPLKMGSTSMQAVIDRADAGIDVQYRVDSQSVVLNMSLREAGNDRLLAASSAKIPLRLLPEELIEQTVSVTRDIQLTDSDSVTSTNIELEVTSHLGDGQTYEDGDVISYFVSSDQDAFLLMIYEDAEGNLIQILPNENLRHAFFSADEYFEVPTEKDNFEFKITKPYGLETVWAFASNNRFPKLTGRRLDNGLALLHERDTQRLLTQIRQYATKLNAAYGEAKTTITTIPKIEN